MNEPQNFISDRQTNLILKAAKENGLKVCEIKVKNGSKKGDNYVGVITAVEVFEKNGGKSMSFILKHSKHEDVFRAEGQLSSVFIREIKMYGEILPELFKLQAEANIIDPFLGIAKCYGFILEPFEESILMENLTCMGYRMWNRRLPINHDHVVLVFGEYAKFHAVSFAMKYKSPEKFEALTKDLTSVMGTAKERQIFFESYKETALKILQQDETLKNALEECWKNIEQVYTELRTEKFVIQHGDTWCNNMLFKYKEEDLSKPTHLYLLDWQNSKIGSPVWDLVYFFCVCASKEVLFNYRTYLDIYHQILSKNLKEFGCDPDKIFSLKTLKNQWKKYVKMGLYCMLMVGSILVVEESDIPTNFDELRKDQAKTLSDILNLNEERQEQYNKRLRNLMEFLIKENFL